jgi:DNA-binding transcriptional regulator PaaX
MKTINSIEIMDKIVSSNPDMEWDNWTVVVYTDDDGYYTKNGVYRNSKWMTQYRFDMLSYGVWNIPDRFIAHVQV